MVAESVAPMVAESASLKVVPKAFRTGYQWVVRKVAQLVALLGSLRVIRSDMHLVAPTGYQWVVRKVAQLVAQLGNMCPSMSERWLQLLLSSLEGRSAPMLSNLQAVDGSQ
jgi:hypothetical protein